MVACSKLLKDDQLVWRYMNIPAFLDLLQRRALFFPSLKTLSAADPWEGTLWDSQREQFGSVLELSSEDQMKLVKTFERFSQPVTFVNCWHMNEVESAAMWAIYASQQGLVIQSDVGSLKVALHEAKEVYIDPVRYAPTDEDVSDQQRYSLCKRSSFAHERELRVLTVIPDESEIGVHIPVNVTKLVKAVLVNPCSPPWICEAIKNVSRLYGHDFAVQSSRLNSVR